MISDGSGYNQIEAAGLYQYGQAGTLPYEQFPVVIAISTYMQGGSYAPDKAWDSFDYVKTGYTDSAAAATAMSTGVKTSYGIIGLDARKRPQKHLVERCQESGKTTGIVTSVQISHSTPAGFVAHNESRNNYAEIANEIFYKSSLDVIMGAGHPLYNDDNQIITEPNDWDFKYVGSKETWADLSSGKLTSASGEDWVFIQECSEFLALTQGPAPKKVIGIAQVKGTLQQACSGDVHADAYAVPLNQNVPTLAEMTKAALNVLGSNPNGFFLMVEGGAVDWAGHNNQSGRMIEEQVDFNKAVEAVIYWVGANSNWEETL
ncbi:MAG: alkaline phosphatase, partial [Phycisphaerae bacterium]